MAISQSLSSVAALLIALLLLFAPPATPQSSESILSQLSALQSQSPGGVIHLTEDLLRRIISVPAPRPFHFLVFFDARHLHANPELPLLLLKKELSVISSSFQSNNPTQKSRLFFFEIEFQESQTLFAEFGVTSLPHIRLIPPTAGDLKSDSIPMNAPDFSSLAESMVEFIESKTNLTVGPLNRPPILSKPQILILIAIFLTSTAYFIKNLISGNTILHHKTTWISGAIFIYFFSVSGAMYNIIRGSPMFMMDRDDPSKITYFFNGSGMQLGAEGFAVGFLYTIVGLLLALVSHVGVRMKNRSVQRLVMVVALFVSFWAVKNVVMLDNWKSGYHPHGYWPSSWM